MEYSVSSGATVREGEEEEAAKTLFFARRVGTTPQLPKRDFNLAASRGVIRQKSHGAPPPPRRDSVHGERLAFNISLCHAHFKLNLFFNWILQHFIAEFVNIYSYLFVFI